MTSAIREGMTSKSTRGIEYMSAWLSQIVLWVGRDKVRQPLGELRISSLRPSQQTLALFAPTVNRSRSVL